MWRLDKRWKCLCSMKHFIRLCPFSQPVPVMSLHALCIWSACSCGTLSGNLARATSQSMSPSAVIIPTFFNKHVAKQASFSSFSTTSPFFCIFNYGWIDTSFADTGFFVLSQFCLLFICEFTQDGDERNSEYDNDCLHVRFVFPQKHCTCTHKCLRQLPNVSCFCVNVFKKTFS